MTLHMLYSFCIKWY